MPVSISGSLDDEGLTLLNLVLHSNVQVIVDDIHRLLKFDPENTVHMTIYRTLMDDITDLAQQIYDQSGIEEFSDIPLMEIKYLAYLIADNYNKVFLVPVKKLYSEETRSESVSSSEASDCASIESIYPNEDMSQDNSIPDGQDSNPRPGFSSSSYQESDQENITSANDAYLTPRRDRSVEVLHNFPRIERTQFSISAIRSTIRAAPIEIISNVSRFDHQWVLVLMLKLAYEEIDRCRTEKVDLTKKTGEL